MRKIFLLTVMALMAMLSVHAQVQQNPKGLYRLDRFVYENGNSKVPGFSQYKYAADSVGLLIFYTNRHNNRQWNQLQVEIRENAPLLNTGETPQGADGHGNQIFGVTDSQFSFKWYNTRWPNMSNLNEFITEIYVREGIEVEVNQALSMLQNKIEKQNRFSGFWVRVGVTANPDGSGERRQAPLIWKVYAPGMSMVVTPQRNPNVIICDITGTVRYENDTTIYEIGNRCDIRWLSEDSHTLTFMQENGTRLTELWVRGGLTDLWQGIFNTKVPRYRDAEACLFDAEVAGKEGRLKKAEAFINEAVREKDADIVSLCKSVWTIALDLIQTQERYKDCIGFCNRQLELINSREKAGHHHTAASQFYIHQIEIYRAVATYRNGDKTKGKQMLQDRLRVLDSEIERFSRIASMADYNNVLYYCKFMIFDLGYEALGAEETILHLDALALMAPALANQLNSLIMKCRGNCYLLQGANAEAKKIWQQLKEKDPDIFKNEKSESLLKKTFGD